MTSSVIYYSTDARKNEIYLLNYLVFNEVFLKKKEEIAWENRTKTVHDITTVYNDSTILLINPVNQFYLSLPVPSFSIASPQRKR